MTELRVPSRSLPHHSTEPPEDAVSGFLNRKCIQEVGAKRSKDRSWQIFWCQLRGSILDFYKVEGVRPRSQGEPPPRDVYPPPNMLKYKVGFVDLEDALVELDYTSQLHKELQKRRRHLFCLALPNDMEYIFQAPSDHQRTSWVIALQNAARRFEGDDTEFDKLIHQEIKIKAARCSIRQRSRQNVHSFKRVPLRTAGSFDEEYDFSPMAEVTGDPRLLVLKKRLQNKRELLQQFETMYSSFVGENISMYADALPFKLKQDGGSVLVGWREGGRLKGRRHSLPEAQLNTTLEDSGGNDNGSWRASTGDVTVPIIQRLSSAVETTEPSAAMCPPSGTVTKLVQDYYLVPGAEWSLVREGESVCLLGKLANGWYRCIALREAEHQLEPIYAPSRSVISGLSEISADSGLPPSASHSMVGVEPMAPPIPEEGAYPEDSEVFHDNEEPHPPTENGNVSDHKHTPDGHVTPSSDHVTPSNGDVMTPSNDDVILPDGPVPPPVILRRQRRLSSLERPLSYQMATDEVTLFFEEECMLTSAASHSQEDLTRAPEGGGGAGGQDGSEDGPQEPGKPEPQREEGSAREESSQEDEVAGSHPSPIPSDSHMMDSTQSSQEEEAGVGGPSELRHRSQPPASSTRDSQTSRDSLGVSARDSLTSSQTFLVLLHPDPAHLQLSSSHPQSRLMSLLAKEHRTGRYSLPLLGCVPPSVLQPFRQLAQRSPSHSPTHQPAHSSPSHSPTHHPAPPSPYLSPTPSPVHQPSSTHRRQTPVKAASIDIAPSGSYVSSTDHTHSNGILLAAQDDPTHDSDDEVAMEMPMKKTRSSSLPPPRIQHSPPASPTGGPVESNLDHSPGAYRRHRPQTSLSHHLTSSTPDKKSAPTRSPASPAKGSASSPQRSSRSPRRKPYEPIMIFLDSGPTLLRKLFTRRKTIPKQMSLPEGEPLSIPVDHRPSPSLLPPPPSLLGDDFGLGTRMQRVSSVSGRPVRSTGVGLVIGEESSSESESESEESTTSPTTSLHEDSLPSPPHTSPRHTSPQPLPRSVDDSSVFGSHEASPTRDLTRSASEHDSLKLMASTEEAPPTTQVQPTRRNVTLPATFRMTALRTKQRTHSDNIAPQKARSTRRKKRRSWGDATTPELPKVTGIFREPPRGEKRFVFLDPQQPKYGFRLESYGRCREKGRVLQTFVQSVAPGSPAFMGGLYPGDAIIEVNGVNVRYAPVEEVVGKISSVSHTSTEKIKLMVEFADGVTRLERMKRADELKYQMRAKQARLRELIGQESRHLTAPNLPSPHSIILAHELTAWGQTPPITEPGTGPFPHSRHLNNVVSLYQGPVTTLACDALVMPLCAVQDPASERTLHKLLHGGGRELLDELALARHCQLGNNITTQGHQLPILSIYHCVFGDLEESLLSCCRQALETANNQKYNTIAFWIDGFTAAKVSPHVVIETVRLWLQEGTNSARFERVVFAAKSSVSLVQKCLNRYFPLRPLFPKKSDVGVVEGDTEKQDSGEAEHSRGLSPSPSPEDTAVPSQPQSECWAEQEAQDGSSGRSSGEPLPITTAQNSGAPGMIVIGPANSESQV